MQTAPFRLNFSTKIGSQVMPEHSTSSVASSPANRNQKSEQSSVAALRTTPPGKYIVLYDGRCPFCTRQSQRLARLARPELVEAVNFQEPGVLTRFPGLTYEACMQAMHLVTPDGRVFRGAEAIVQALATRLLFAWIAPVYYLPGLRQFFNASYAFIAANRYRFWGKTSPSECESGVCGIHGPLS
jgi:predicted DCC family thiol-disulfide oxidoreductase YuxK